MLFMKEMRQKVIDECTLKESAAINQILGRKVIIRVLILILSEKLLGAQIIDNVNLFRS